jgi:hypothetical protein
MSKSSLYTALFAVLPLASLVAGCALEGSDTLADPGELLAEGDYGAAASDGRSFSAPFLNESTMRNGGEDWAPCHGKATCANDETIRGVSRIPDGPGRTALCTKGGNYSGQVQATLTMDARSDQRRASRAVGGNPDWDFGHYKLECGDGEYVSAVSEDAAQCSGSNAFHGIQCSKGAGLRSDGCSVRAFGGGDDRGDSASGDWDNGAFKGECAANEYAAGVSLTLDTLAPHALLCCPADSVGGGGGGVTPGNPFFGLSIDHPSWGPEQAKTIRDLGGGLVRIQFCDWPANKPWLDSAVNAAKAAGLEVFAELNYCTVSGWNDTAQWHAGFNDAGNEFSGLFTATAQDIATFFQGRVRFYEIWNEPNASPRPFNWQPGQWASPANSDWNGACTNYRYGGDYGQDDWALCPKQLGVLTTNAFMAIKGADPSAKVVTGNMLFHGTDGWVAKEYWKQVEQSPAVNWHRQNKGGVPWDYVGIHPYAYRPTDGTLEAQINSFKGIMASFGDDKPVALTEYGWTTAGGDPVTLVDEGTQAAYLKATFAVAQKTGVGFVSWFNYLDGGGINYGMRRADNGWKPSARAFCEVTGTASCPAP